MSRPLDLGMLTQPLADALDEPFDLLERRLVAHTDGVQEERVVALREVADAGLHDVAVGHRQLGAVELADARRAGADVLDRAVVLPEAHEVTDLEGLVREERHAADEVLQRGLGGEADDQAADAGAGQQPQRRDADLFGADEDDEHDADGADDPRDQAQQVRVVALVRDDAAWR